MHSDFTFTRQYFFYDPVFETKNNFVLYLDIFIYGQLKTCTLTL